MPFYARESVPHREANNHRESNDSPAQAVRETKG